MKAWRGIGRSGTGLVAALSLLTGSLACAVEPPAVFVKNCAPCHGKDGRAQTPAAKKLGVKDLTQSKFTDEQIVQAIREGKQPSKASAKMPAFKDKLTAEEIKVLVAAVKSFRK